MSDETRREERAKSEPTWPGFALPRGTVINGYRIERILGSGGFGITYLALDLLQQRFAIKEYYPQQFATREHMTVRPITTADAAMFEDCRERFLREAQALVLLGRVAGASEGIVRVQTYFEAFGTCFLVMDYVEGASLANVFRQEPGGLPPARVRSLLTQLLSSIRFVHQAGLVHRDIKPANVIVRDGDRLMLIDFGATRQATPNETATFTQIYSGGYGPPEQMLGHRQGEFSDIYAIGAVCYRAIGGRVANALARRNSLQAGMPDPQPTAASVGAGRYPSSLLAAIDAALSVEPAQRPQSADAMLAILGSDEPPLAIAVPVVERGSRRRGTWIAAAAGAVVLAGVAYLALRIPAAPPPVAEPVPAPHVAAPTPPPPMQPPQQEAIIVPPPMPVPVPEPPRPVAPAAMLERALEVATTLPCSALLLAADGDGVHASGFAPAGQDLDWFLAGLRDLGRVSDDVTRVDRWACPGPDRDGIGGPRHLGHRPAGARDPPRSAERGTRRSPWDQRHHGAARALRRSLPGRRIGAPPAPLSGRCGTQGRVDCHAASRRPPAGCARRNRAVGAGRAAGHGTGGRLPRCATAAHWQGPGAPRRRSRNGDGGPRQIGDCARAATAAGARPVGKVCQYP